MVRHLVLVDAILLATGCGKMVELVSQTKIVAAPREQVFARMFDDRDFSELPLVTNGRSNRLYALVVEKGHPEFAKIAPHNRPDAFKVKLSIAMHIPRETHILYSVDDGALSTGLKFTFEEIDRGTTRVSCTIDELTGHDAEGLRNNVVELHALARRALDKLDDFDMVDAPA